MNWYKYSLYSVAPYPVVPYSVVPYSVIPYDGGRYYIESVKASTKFDSLLFSSSMLYILILSASYNQLKTRSLPDTGAH